MKNILTAKQIKQAEQTAFSDGVSVDLLMHNAGVSVANELAKRIDVRRKNIIILCGNGNNGGDGFVCAKALCEKDAFVKIFLTGEKPKTTVAKNAYKELPETVEILNKKSLYIELDECDVVIDAIYGFGFHGEIDTEISKILYDVNNHDCYKVAIDVPSGVECDTGRIGGACFNSSLTVTFTALKPYCYLYPSREMCGEIVVCDVGLPQKYTENLQPYAQVIQENDAVKILPLRKNNSHKGTFGNVLMCTGSEGMYGASILCAKSALKSGVGLVYQYTDIQNYPLFVNSVPEIVTVFENNILEKINSAKAIVCGCGLGKSQKAIDTVNLIKNANCAKLFDADALNILSLQEKNQLDNTVITPHPAEAARLLGVSTADIQNDRMSSALVLCEKYKCTVLLKGAFTIIASPFNIPVIIDCQNSGLAKGGSGDCLSGIIGALLAQGINCFDSACLGAYIHAKAADFTKDEIGEYSMQPTDVINNLHKIFKNLYLNKKQQ